MMYEYDSELTKAQQTLKWSLYGECDLEEDSAIEAVLKSLLKDILKEKTGDKE